MHAATHPARLRRAPSSVEAETLDGGTTDADDTEMHNAEDTHGDADDDGTAIHDREPTADDHAGDATAEPTEADILDALDAEADEECDAMRTTVGEG